MKLYIRRQTYIQIQRYYVKLLLRIIG